MVWTQVTIQHFVNNVVSVHFSLSFNIQSVSGLTGGERSTRNGHLWIRREGTSFTVSPTQKVYLKKIM